MDNEKSWFVLAAQLVWPIFIVVLILVFRSESAEIYNILKDRIKSGSALKVGLFEIGEQASKTEISALVFPDLPVEAIGGPAEAVLKESGPALQRLQEALSKSPFRRVDTLIVDSGVIYSPTLLKDYINTLGVKFIVFRKNKRFDGWIEAGLFLNQLISRLNMPSKQLKEVTIPYDELKRGIVGISQKAAQAKDSARRVLQVMQEAHTENLPVLDSQEFKFFANRGEILANLISKFILKEKEGTEKDQRSIGGG
jgi:hypothetical protein